MEKKNIDWGNLGFGYMPTDKRFVANYKNGAWDEGALIDDPMITMSECACVLQYAQTCFEGIKAYTTEQGKIVTFRPDLNAKRMADSERRLQMPVFPEDRFVQAVVDVVKANAAYVPPYGSGATLYIRPYMFGINPVIGVKPSNEYQFRILVTPVGPYFKGGAKPITICVSDFDRAAPHGTGAAKVGGNYAASMLPGKIAHDSNFSDVIYLDPATHTKIEEVGSANFFGITADNEFITPLSPSILPSITKFSLLYLAENRFGMKAIQGDVKIAELDKFVEAGACGTAAVITPIGGVQHGDDFHVFYSETEVGPVTRKLYDELTGIQFGDVEAPEGWIVKVD